MVSPAGVSGISGRERASALHSGGREGTGRAAANFKATLQNVHFLDPVSSCKHKATSPRLSEAQLGEIEAAVKDGQQKGTLEGVAQGWKAFAKYGDRYAAAAARALSDPGSSEYKAMHKALELEGVSDDQPNFIKAAQDHLQHYVEMTKDSPEGGKFRLPSSTKIETSYYDSLVKNKVSPYVNIANLAARIEADPRTGSFDTWHDCAGGYGINLPDDRKGPPSNIVKELKADKAGKRYKQILDYMGDGYWPFDGTIARLSTLPKWVRDLK
jgi:hypothetical protein